MYEQVQLRKDAAENFTEEMPLALKLEKYQRRKLLEGLKPVKDSAQKESLVYLQSLKYVQQISCDEPDELNKELRGRMYEDYMADPMGNARKIELEMIKNKAIPDPFYEAIKFIEDWIFYVWIINRFHYYTSQR